MVILKKCKTLSYESQEIVDESSSPLDSGSVGDYGRGLESTRTGYNIFVNASSGKPGYKYLETYRLATVIYDLTVEFCRLFLDPRSRTTDQMIQAGRSGKQNIAEGYLERSLKSYIKLLGVALASIGELLEDYEDFLRQRGLLQWDKNDSRVREMRRIPHDSVLAANLMITLCQRAIFLLGRQIASLEQKFIQEGGYTENLFKKRLAQRGPR